ncbi:MAG: hypothetical protein JNL83_06015 [Myxococcales bacterium]|nr:hypothetical protein [Myxococcales bacterium]
MRLACSLLCLAACTKPGATTMPTTGTAAMAAQVAGNHSIATARALRAGDTVDFQLPCNGDKVVFGPFAFAAENDRVELVTTARSTNGDQVCGPGNWTDGDGAFVAVAGVGCVDGPHEYTARHENVFTPGAGGTAATPQYLEFHRDNPVTGSCGTLAVHLVAKAVPGGDVAPGTGATAGTGAAPPGGGGPLRPVANPTLGSAAEAAQRDRVLAMLMPSPRDGGARRALLSLGEASAINDTTYAAQGVKRADVERAMDELKSALAGDEKSKKAALDAFAARWSPTFAKLRAAAGMTSTTPVGGEVSIRDCVRDGKGGPKGSKVEIRDCVRDKNMLYRALSASGEDATRAKLAPNGVFTLSKLLATPGNIPPESPNAPPFDSLGSRSHEHGFLDQHPFIDARGIVRLPPLDARYAENKFADAFASKAITTGDSPKTVIAEIRYGTQGYVFGVGYAATGFTSALLVHDANNNVVCRDQRQEGSYAPVLGIGQGTITAPRFVACTVPARTTATIVVGVSSWAVAGGLALAGHNGSDGSIGIRIVDVVPLTEY